MHHDRLIEELFTTINQLRQSPTDAVHRFQHLDSLYSGKIFRGRFKTREGPTAVKDLLYDLKSRHGNDQKLKWSFGLHMIADEKARILGENGLSTTEGSMHHQTLP